MGDPNMAAGSPPPVDGDKDARTMAMLAHLLGGLFGFLGPLVIWLIKKDQSAFVDSQGKEALNFQLTLLLVGYLPSVILSVVTCGLASPLVFIPMLLQIIFGIIACIQANNGVDYRYPFNIRLVK